MPALKINILGTEYTITVKKYDEDDEFSHNDCNGYCSGAMKQIVLCDMSTYKGWEHELPEVVDRQQKATLRHEIVHAFLRESGLWSNGNQIEGSWAMNEEMVDWFALQGQKIYKAWQEADAL